MTLQGDIPWDEKEFRYLAVTAAGLGSVLLYLYFRDNGREISWKDFVHRYISRGVVRRPFSRTSHCACVSHGLDSGAESVCVCVQVDRLEVVNKQYVRVILVPGADPETVRGNRAT